ncbi:hypothetical protein OC846_006558 [Tilletia horrida]|uniref:Uncharacterized protein n=1 Tax=Tilletia horrida TaxID=155126 RepID=A0AAN6GKT7_9BASI|nr:hypothetical protein OC846_006558 [Tilletia horrida]KAK0559472.1 hypothetical protein OC861_006632 [Tilletia horrida]
MQPLETDIKPPDQAPLPDLLHLLPIHADIIRASADGSAAHPDPGADAMSQSDAQAQPSATANLAATGAEWRHEQLPGASSEVLVAAGPSREASGVRSNGHSYNTRRNRQDGKGNLSLKEAATTLTMLSKPASSGSHAQSASPESNPQPLPTNDSTSAQLLNETSDAPDPTQPLPPAASPAGPADPPSSAAPLIAPAPTDDQARYDTARSWPMRAGLQGTRAQFYRGPLGAEEVLALLSQDISDNGRRALTAESRAGYLKYFHFLGPSEVPASKRRKGATTGSAVSATGEASSSGAAASQSKSARVSPVGREGWQCRCCHHELHVPTGQIGNLSGHLYGTKGRPGCLELRADKPAESIPPPPRNESGQLIRHGANKDQPMTRNQKAD